MSIDSHIGGYLLFEDNSHFEGESFYGTMPTFGEAVFNTSHSGYQEILTDPSYCRQIMVFTAPHIGNVGVNKEDVESGEVQVAGAVVRSLSPRPQNWRSEEALSSWLKTSGRPLLAGADTRSITLHLRTRGAMRAGLFPGNYPPDQALEEVKSSSSMEGSDLASQVTCKSPYDYDPGELDNRWYHQFSNGEGCQVALLDFGVKTNILRELARRSCHVTVFPSTTDADTILNGGFQGVMLSNGPGDPAAVTYAIKTIRTLIGKIPIFGICLGHQLLSLSAGLETYKLPFGHRGANHPVRREEDKVIEITSQNHGFAVDPDKMTPEWRITHINLNDGTVEGLQHNGLPIFSIQYHPEASPGPHEGTGYFDKFIRNMRHAQK
ncbi:glutamine-hydrolyzing carbamoyl-phosphate synthase small subunit [Thermodesulfobacteriota bacterium]